MRCRDQDSFVFGADEVLYALLRPAQRASVLMFIIGGLFLICGLFIGLIGTLPMTPEQTQLPHDMLSQLHKAEQETGIKIPVFFIIMGIIIALPALIMIILGFFVRRGGLVSAILAIILTSVLLLMSGFNVLAALRAGPAQLVVPVILLVMLILLETWVIQAARRTREIRAVQLTQQRQYPQAMQHQYQYQQPYPGQWQAPPPPPPPTN